MTKRIVEIQPEVVLIEYLYRRLGIGITEPIFADNFFQLLKRLAAECEAKFSDVECSILDLSFSDIVLRANTMLSNFGRISLEYISKERESVMPTYNFVKQRLQTGVNSYIITSVLDKVFETEIRPVYIASRYLKDADSISYEAKQVAALYVNNLIERYVKDAISDHRWPKQCSNIDEYIFDRNIAQILAEPGTDSLFYTLYVHAMGVVQDLLDEAGGSEVIFSNHDSDVLAYANYMKFMQPEIFEFLKKFSHNHYKTNDLKMVVKIHEGKVEYTSKIMVYSDPYDDDDTWRRAVRFLGDEEVNIMKIRLR